MSLLMDALRRAEADKKAQEERAARAAGEEPGSDHGGITRISPHSKSQDDTVQIDGRMLQAAAATMTDFDLRIDDNLDRSLTMTAPEDLRLEPLEHAAAASGNDTDFLPMDGAADQDFDAAEYGGNLTFKGRVERREQTATLPNARGMSSDLDDYFDRSQSVAAPRTPASSEDGTLDEVAAHTVAGAHTVFRAGERPRSGRLLTWIAAIAVCIVLGIAGFGVYYAGLSPTPHVVPSPEVARGVEKVGTDLHSPVPAPAPSSDGNAALARIDTQPPPVSDTAPAGLPGNPPDTSITAPRPREVAPRPVAAAPAHAAPARPAPRRAAASAGFGLSEEIASGEVQISRSKQPDRVETTLAQAYAAFQAGKFDDAGRLYNSARALAPDRRDTLLGLGAVALKRGDLAGAYRFYAEVLKRYPGDPVASAALFSMTEADGEGGAARLRLLLDGHADAAYIHAALGNWYARRQRWPDAQQAYFDAARLDAGNPDYAFNLAVSLDHLGQGAAALDYYQKSLALRAQRGAGFNAQAAQERIGALSASTPGTRP